jgi:hypothetical protein
LLARSAVRRRIQLSCSGGIASPVALAGDEVCLPRRALMELEPSEQDSMLAHEIAHLVRRDPQWLVAARVIETVLFMQPLNRLARHRLQEVAEYLCDDWAVARTSHPVTLAKCLAAVAEWVRRAPAMDATRLQPMSAMIESGGSPLVRRVGRILGERAVAPAGRAGVRRALGVSACALVALTGVAPRISVANGALSDRTITFVREIVDAHGVRPTLDSAVLFTRGVARVRMDSLARQALGASAGPVDRANVVYRRVSIERAVVDSAGSVRIWTRPLPPPSGVAAGGRVMPTKGGERERVLVMKRRNDR